MFTEIIIPQERSVRLEVPEEMVGHRVRVTMDDMEAKKAMRPKTIAEVLARFSPPRLDTLGWKFNRDEANER